MQNKTLINLAVVVALVIMCIFGTAANTIYAANFLVTKASDSNDATCNADCSLREAVAAANVAASNDTITFAPSLNGTPVTLSAAFGGEIQITNNGTLTITGSGANLLVISGGGTSRIFYTDHAFVTVKNVTLQNGNGTGANFSGCGGAVFTFHGTLILDAVIVQNNSAGSCNGGGVYLDGGIGTNHRILNSTFANNSAFNCGSFINSSGPLFIANTTFTGNSATGSGGDGGGFCNNAITNIRNSTITANNAVNGGEGGGIYNVGTLDIGNTIIAGNIASNFPEISFESGAIQAVGGNFVGDSTGDSTNTDIAITYQGTNVFDISPQLIALGNYGGNVPTRPLQFSSPARDAGTDVLAVDPFDDSALTKDQRGAGFPRVVDTAGGTDDVDIGAFEVQDFRFYVTQTADATGACDDNCALREAIMEVPAGGTVDFARTFTFAAPILVNLNEIQITKNLTVAGYGANQIKISGNNSNRIFYLAGSNVMISGVTLTAGNGVGTLPIPTSGPYGGAIFVNGGAITLSGVHVNGNSVPEAGGGIYFYNGATHRINNSTFSNNSAARGAGFYNDSAVLITISNSTISNNTAGGGGGFYSNDEITLRNVTITGNSASEGGGMTLSSGTLDISNTIIAGNSGVSQPEIRRQPVATVISNGSNLVGDSVGDSTNTMNAITYQGSDILDTPPMLGALTDANGGTTPTHALLSGSPAIDAGENSKAVDPFDGSPLLRDQRGFQRIVDAPFAVPVVDIGAFEFAALQPTAASVSVSGKVTAGKGYAVYRATVTLTDSLGAAQTTITNPFGYYRFDDVRVGETYVFNVVSKRYQFSPQVVTVMEEINDLYFSAVP